MPCSMITPYCEPPSARRQSRRAALTSVAPVTVLPLYVTSLTLADVAFTYVLEDALSSYAPAARR